MKWLAKNQKKLKSNIFTADLIIGLKSDTLFNTKQYFTSLLLDLAHGPAQQMKYYQKIERFASYLYSFESQKMTKKIN